ncbi:protein SMG9 [Medicago truncatula]|nr:protein SMG9 [Medicago truncatula]
MAGPDPSPSPKILLSKSGLVTSKLSYGGSGEEDSTPHRPHLPSVASLNLLSDSWNFHFDRFLPFLTENTDFTVIGVIGRPGVGKSTIMNELYGFDSTSHGMLPPFAIQSEENRAMAKDCSIGIEPRISSERIILLDTQPVFSASVLAETIKPDGSSTIPVMRGESLSAELAHELMDIQVDLLKHDISDPSLLASSLSQSSNSGIEKDNKVPEREYLATPVFIHTKLQGRELSPRIVWLLSKALMHDFKSSSFVRENTGNNPDEHSSSKFHNTDMDSNPLKLFAIPFKKKEDNPRVQHESYISALWKLRDQILSMKPPSFKRPVSEREWLKSSAKIWEQVRNSSTISEYGRALQHSGIYRT